MNHRCDVGPRLEDCCVDEAFQIGLALVTNRFAHLIELDQIVMLDQLWRQRARHKEMLRIIGMAHADMAIGVDHVFVGEDAIGNDEVAEDIVELAHGVLSLL